MEGVYRQHSENPVYGPDQSSMSVELQMRKTSHLNGSGTEKPEVDTADVKINEPASKPESTSISIIDMDGSKLPDGPDPDPEEDPDSPPPSSLCCVYRISYLFRRFLAQNWSTAKVVFLVMFVLAYLVYFSYCMWYEFSGEPSIRLLVGTIIGVLVLVNKFARRFLKCPCALSPGSLWDKETRRGQMFRKVSRWCLYILSVGGAVTVIGVDVIQKRPENLICVAGLALLVLVSFFISRQPDKVNWHAVFWGLSLQFWFAVLIMKTEIGATIFRWLADRCVELIHYTDKGSQSVFGKSYSEHYFIFQVMPTLIFFNALIAVFYYWGLVQIFIAKFGKFLGFCLGTSPIECVNAASNLFLTLSEAPILIKPFMADITKSEMFAVMTGGFASIAGFLLYVFGANGAPINHILAASVMSAPAALAFAKLIYPDERPPTIKAEDAYKVDVGHYGSLLGALSKGAKEGLTMVGYVVINVIVYVAVLEFLDQTLQWFAERAGVHDFTFTKLISYVFYPLTYMMGFPARDCLVAARLLGVKIFTQTVISFQQLGTIVKNSEALQEYIDTYNGTWSYVDDDIFLGATNVTLKGGVMTERSGVLATYMICGLSSLGAIGVAIGAFTSLAPTRATVVYEMVVLALIAGNIASFSTACVAGLLFTE